MTDHPLTENTLPWKPLNGGKVRVGDEVRRDCQGIIRIAIVGHVDDDGNPWNAEGILIGEIKHDTWYFRRRDLNLPTRNRSAISPTRDLPTSNGSVIISADSHKRIEAVVHGRRLYAREAVLVSGRWRGAWRTDTATGIVIHPSVAPQHIILDTWKVDEQ